MLISRSCRDSRFPLNTLDFLRYGVDDSLGGSAAFCCFEDVAERQILFGGNSGEDADVGKSPVQFRRTGIIDRHILARGFVLRRFVSHSESQEYSRSFALSTEKTAVTINNSKGESLAHKIKDLRKSKGLTQPDLAALCGVSQASVSQWESENDKRNSIPTSKSLLKLSELAPESERQFWRDLAAEQVGFDLEASDISGLPSFSQKLRLVPLLKEGSKVDALGVLSPNDIERELHFPEQWFPGGGVIRALHVQGKGMEKLIALVDISRKDPGQLIGSLVATRTTTGIEVHWLGRNKNALVLLPFHPNQPVILLQESGEDSLVGFVCCTVGDGPPITESRMQ